MIAPFRGFARQVSVRLGVIRLYLAGSGVPLGGAAFMTTG